MIISYLFDSFDPLMHLPIDGGEDFPGIMKVKWNKLVGKKLKDLQYYSLRTYSLDPKIAEKLVKKTGVTLTKLDKPASFEHWGFAGFVVRENPKNGELVVWRFERI